MFLLYLAIDWPHSSLSQEKASKVLRITLILLLLVPALSVSAAEIVTQLNSSNVQQFKPRGPDAIGGIDDWLLSNGTMCAVVSDVAHESGLMAWGGSLVDVYHCESGNDQWSFHHVIPNIDKDLPFKPVSIDAFESNGKPGLRVEFAGVGLNLRSEYSFVSSSKTQMRVVHSLTRSEENASLTMLGLLALHPHASLAPFSISTKYAEYGLGFSYPGSDMNDTLSVVDALVPADIHVYVGDSALGEVSYGVQTNSAVLVNSEGERELLPVFQQTASTYSMQGVFSRSPWFGGEGKLGLLEFAQSQLMDIDIGESLEIVQTFYLGRKSDVASIADQIYQGPLLNGVTNAIDTTVHIVDESGNALSSVRSDASGAFSVRLPEGTSAVTLQLRSAGSNTTTSHAIDITGPITNTGTLASDKVAQLAVENELPVRLTFIGVNGTKNPDFYRHGPVVLFGGSDDSDVRKANYISLTGLNSDVTDVQLPPGSYRVIASRGMAYGVTETTINLKAGANPPLIVNPPLQEVDTNGLFAADFHVHSAPSFDSSIPVEERLRGFVAQGGDVLIATEHNVLVDYQDRVTQLGLQDHLKVIGGIELTGMARTPSAPFTNGHLNVFPVQARPNEFSGGMPRHEGLRLRELYASFGDSDPRALFQLNHPRTAEADDEDFDGNFFEHLYSGQRYDPKQDLASSGNKILLEKEAKTNLRDLDFDLLEVANGPAYGNYKRTQTDWFSLLSQGERIVGSANSDTHGTRHLVAIPQNFVVLDDYNEEAFLSAVKEGRMSGSTGPILKVFIENEPGKRKRPGDTYTGNSFVLNVNVQAASWVPVAELSLVINGDIAQRQAVSAGDTITLPIELTKDSYIVVEVNGEASELYNELAPDFRPFAFSNPIYVDADQDGQWTAPGL